MVEFLIANNEMMEQLYEKLAHPDLDLKGYFSKEFNRIKVLTIQTQDITTVTLFDTYSSFVYACGIARLSPSDDPDNGLGLKIATGRALKQFAEGIMEVLIEDFSGMVMEPRGGY